MTRDYDFDRIYKNFIIIKGDDFYCIDPDEALNFIYWSDDVVYNIFKSKVDNRNLINFSLNAHALNNGHTSVSGAIMGLPEYQFLHHHFNTVYLGEITESEFKKIGKAITESNLLKKYFMVIPFMKNYYSTGTINSGPGPSGSDYKYCLYLTIENKQDLINLTTYSRLVKHV